MAERLCALDVRGRLACLCLPSGEDAATLAANNGFHDLASKLTRHAFIALRARNLRARIGGSAGD